jgi:hypothetical protein
MYHIHTCAVDYKASTLTNSGHLQLNHSQSTNKSGYIGTLPCYLPPHTNISAMLIAHVDIPPFELQCLSPQS